LLALETFNSRLKNREIFFLMLPRAQGWAVKPCLPIFRTLLVILYICLDLCTMRREMDFLQIDDFDIWVQVPLVLKVELPSLAR
jgi:hypothetical protein